MGNKTNYGQVVQLRQTYKSPTNKLSNGSNQHNETTKKNIRSTHSEFKINVIRNREGTFEPLIIET